MIAIQIERNPLYVFHDSVDIRSLAVSLGAFLRQARSFGPNTSLVLFTKPDRVLPLDVYRETFWSLLRELVRQDNRPWPDHIPVELRDPLWEFSFAGEPVFVICNTPEHLLRQSRRSSCFMVTFQPRWVFDKILEAVFELGFGHGMSENRSVSGAKTPEGLPPFQGFATQKWAIFVISLQDAADFPPEGVKSRLWSAAPRRGLFLFREKIRFAPSQIPIQRQPLGTDTAAEKAFSMVRKRLVPYDLVPVSPCLGKYGTPDVYEYQQYFLGDDNEPAVCPFRTLFETQSAYRDKEQRGP